MKKLSLLAVAVAIALMLNQGCGTIIPVARDACTYAKEICTYAGLLCALVNDTTATRQQIAQVRDSLVCKTQQLSKLTNGK